MISTEGVSALYMALIRDFPSKGMGGIPQPAKNSLILPPHLENSPSQ